MTKDDLPESRRKQRLVRGLTTNKARRRRRRFTFAREYKEKDVK